MNEQSGAKDQPKSRKKPAGKQLRIELPEDITPIYANIVRVAHSPSEIIFDFASFLPGDTSIEIQTRILMTPVGAKVLHRTLSDNMERYEAAFGEISLPKRESLADQLFKQQPPASDPPDDEGT